jgi:V/A-type H+-transporting ATPase subunit A
MRKQNQMMHLILLFYDRAAGALEMGADIEEIVSLPVRERIGRCKYISECDVDDEVTQIESQLAHELSEILDKEDI